MISMWKTACLCTSWKKLDHGLKETWKPKSLLSTYGISSILFFLITVLNLRHSGGLHALNCNHSRICKDYNALEHVLEVFLSPHFCFFFSCFFCSFPSFVGSLHAALQNGVTWRAFLGILQVKHRYLSRISTLWDSKAPKSQISRFAMILHVSDHSSTIAHACCMLHAVQTSSNGLLATIQR